MKLDHPCSARSGACLDAHRAHVPATHPGVEVFPPGNREPDSSHYSRVHLLSRVPPRVKFVLSPSRTNQVRPRRGRSPPRRQEPEPAMEDKDLSKLTRREFLIADLARLPVLA
jgi:hypothetical protein